MKIHNFSEIKSTGGKLTLGDRISGIYKYGFSWPQDLNAQDVFTMMLQRDVDQRSTLIRDFTLPDVEVTVPFILIGPPGVLVILITRERGMFRAREGQWLIHTGKGFVPANENLIHRTQLYIRATQKYLDDHGFQDVFVTGLVVGVNPGMHVETHNSAVRVIQSDAIRRFVTQWEQEQTELSPEEIYQIVSTIIRSATPEVEAEGVNPRTALLEQSEAKINQSLQPLQKTFNFSPKQWAILGVLIAATIFVLLVFMLFLLLSI